ncbi:HTH_XRE domain containing protein [uncultured Caudovirales phage]|uniref:HTH_XRE domain containing protein n=1 Tax=uncultured Caudovirales phage TaxID=2100421 RepID=A0A6J5RJH3_9CAUD|nr:HTH_XRE domain containing protein [uncultured Caudovirales phage]
METNKNNLQIQIMDPKQKQMAEMIRDARTKKGMSLNALARIAKMQPTQISIIESGKLGMTMTTAIRLCRALKIKIQIP